MKRIHATIFVFAGLVLSLVTGQIKAQDFSGYRSELNIVYSTVAGRDLTLNAFLPMKAAAPTPAIVEIHAVASKLALLNLAK